MIGLETINWEALRRFEMLQTAERQALGDLVVIASGEDKSGSTANGVDSTNYIYIEENIPEAS